MDKGLGGRGVVLEKEFNEQDLIVSPDAFQEDEVLTRGRVTGAVVTWVQ